MWILMLYNMNQVQFFVKYRKIEKIKLILNNIISNVSWRLDYI